MRRSKLAVLLGLAAAAIGVAARSTSDAEVDLGLKPVFLTMQEISGNEPPRVFTLKMLLFTKQYPITTANFMGLCKGIEWQGRSLSYTGTKMHRIIPGFVVQGGDIVRGDGTGSVSAVKPDGSQFEDEKDALISAGKKAPQRNHDRPGMLAMANSGRNTNGSQFYITLGPGPNEENHFSHLDGRHTVFGKVVEGMPELMQTVQRYEQVMYQEIPGSFELSILGTSVPDENDPDIHVDQEENREAGDTAGQEDL